MALRALAFALAVALLVPAVAPAARCPGGIENGVYRCDVTPEAGDPFQDCFRVGDDADTLKFGLRSDLLGDTIACTCNAKGKPAKPKFGVGPTFGCVGLDGLHVTGRAARKGSRIVKGQVTNADGGVYVFLCQRDDACALP